MTCRPRILLLLLLVITASSGPLAQTAGSGTIRGTVWDRDFEAPLAGARVTVAEAGLAATTGTDGTFAIEGVPAGLHTVVVAKDGYERQVISGVAVTPGHLTEVRAEIAAEVVEMEELVVTGADPVASEEVGLLEIRAESVTLQDSISAELIGKAGVSDAAGALKLVTGASVVGGKYATVRGLSDRYTGTTLNGIRVPSPDPRRRAVQVDLFPTGTIESVTVTKTFTPDLQGDFTGGGVDIRTKAIPEAKFLKVSFSGEYNAGATGNGRFLTYENGGVGALGISGDGRDLPEIARRIKPPQPPRARITSGTGASTPTPQETEAAATIDAYTSAFEPVMGVSRGEAAPGVGTSIVAGNRYDISEQGLFGWLAAWTYARKSDFYEQGANNTAGVSDASQGFVVSRVNEDGRGTEEVLMGLLANAVVEPSADHRYAFRIVANHAAEDEARLQIQRSQPMEQNQSLQYVERTLLSPQVEGNHTFRGAADGSFARMKFSDVRLDWRTSVNFTRQFEPDVRFFRNSFDPASEVAFKIGGSNDADLFRRVFRDIKERNAQVAADVTLPFTQWSESEGRVRVGTYVESSSRDYEQRSFAYHFNGSQTRPRTSSDTPAWQENLRIGGSFSIGTDCVGGACGEDRLWTDVFLRPDRVGLARNLTTISNQILWHISPLGDDVDYAGEQDLRAAYAMIELPLVAKLRLTAGARWEQTKLAIDPTAPFDPLNRLFVIVVNGENRGLGLVPAAEAAAAIDESHVLPAVALTWTIRDAMQARASWSSTIARPTFRELAPVATAEYLAGDQFIGNNELKLSDITNWDLRWEWFRRPGEVLAASVFYKKLFDPIEYISFSVVSNSYVQPVNYERGTVKGFELEARTELDVVWKRLKGLAVGANFTRIDSEVEVPGSEQRSLADFGLAVPTRRLLGQPSSVFNANVTYDNERTGTSAGVFYNRVGDILLTGGARGDVDGIADVFEDVDKSLDVTFSQKLPRGVSLGLRLRNILEGDRRTLYIRPSGDRFVKTQRSTNRTISFSFSWNL